MSLPFLPIPPYPPEVEAIDFEDCVIVAQIERNQMQELLSYDTDFDRFRTIRRLEPGAQERHTDVNEWEASD